MIASKGGDFIENLMENRIKLLRRLASADRQYQIRYCEFPQAEHDFFELLLELTEQQQDRLWRFVNLSNEVDERLQEIACEYLVL